METSWTLSSLIFGNSVLDAKKACSNYFSWTEKQSVMVDDVEEHLQVHGV